jgi:2-keto-4-pentenoate hydratase/2-oxohepta-3-ene-1,7-dioic acid hydratase in catechol pathway
MKSIKFTNGKSAPIANIYCIGQNYALHNKEMGTPAHSDIVVFMKPTGSIIYSGDECQIPKISDNMHHELEMVIAIAKDGKDVSASDAKNYIAGVGLGIDLTLRDVQKIAKDKGRPWATAKGFYTSAPISEFMPIEEVNDFTYNMTLKVNGELRQQGTTADMMYSVETLVSYISEVFSLQEGDLIFTGTPEGVARLISGDKVEAELGDGKLKLNFSVK